ncbi:MAG: LysR substrate-binding domain-containing protein [Gammaproteobacteria bacterium]
MSEAIIETSAGRIAAPGMQDLNDLYLFTLVVEKGSFTAASRAAALTTSRISRRIADLEERLGVRLLHRTTRKLTLTAVGAMYYQHCRAMVTEAEAAAEVVEHIQASPRGRVRVTCPTLTAQSLLGEIITDFIERYPEVGVTLAATDRLVDLIDEGFDVAIRFRNTPLEESNLVARTLGESRSYLVASPAFLERHGHPQQPGELSRLSSLGKSRHDAAYAWHLTHADGRSAVIPFRPLLDSDDWVVIKQAALAGLGVAAIPGELCHEEITEGTLNIVLPDWNLPGINLYLLYTSRRGLIPAVRAFIDFAAERLAYSCKVQAQNMRSTMD